MRKKNTAKLYINKFKFIYKCEKHPTLHMHIKEKQNQIM